MNINSTLFKVNYSPINELRKKIVNNWSLVGFNEPTILPIPDDAPDEIPRVICQSMNGHTSINISKDSLSMYVNFDGEYLENWNLCQKYLSEKLNNVICFLNSIGCSFSFSGLVTQIFYNLEELRLCVNSEENATKSLFEKFSKVKTDFDVFDFEQKITTLKEETFFVNYSFNNLRTTNEEISINKPGCLKTVKAKNDHIAVSIDVNDRYAFNYDESYKADISVFSRLLTITDESIKGIYDLFLK